MDNFQNFEEIADEVTKSHSCNKSLLWHYTDTAGLLGIISNTSLWATSFQHLNDPSEFKYGLALISEVALTFPWSFAVSDPSLIENLKQFWSQESSNPGLKFFICSLSESYDSSHQWKRYGNEGLGGSLGFAIPDLPIGDRIRLYKVEYHRDKQIQKAKDLCSKFDNLISLLLQKSSLNKQQFSPILLDFWKAMYFLSVSFKHQDWCPEEEWRLVVFPSTQCIKYRTRAQSVVPYTIVQLQLGMPCLKKILLGPQLEHKDEIATNLLVSTSGLNCLVARSFAPII